MRPPKPTGSSLQGLIEQGVALHRAGRVEEARGCYKRVLQRDPKNFNALHFLGVVCMQAGQGELAVAMLARAAAVNPGVAEVQSVLGVAYAALDRLGEALASYDKALALKPGLVDAHYNRAGVLARLGRPEEALASYDIALTLAPKFAEASYNQGLLLDQLGRSLEACASYDRAIAVRPDFADALFNRGLALQRLGRLPEALASFDDALAVNPGFAKAHYSRGLVLQALHRSDEALKAMDAALALAPDDADAHRTRALILHQLRRPTEAIESFSHALRYRPDDAMTLAWRGISLLQCGRLDEGWRDYEGRLRTPDLAGDLRGGDAPVWRGEALAGRVLYLHSEQGFGDTIQFCRYALRVEPGASIILEVQPALKRLLSTLPGPIRVIARGEPIPSFDAHGYLLSLPMIFATRVETIPAATPYLTADPAAAARWRARLADLPSLKVGLVWAGSPRLSQPDTAELDRRRSIPLETLAPFGEVPGVTFVSLQKGPPSAEAGAPPPGLSLVDFTAELDDFADTAALVEALDLVISVDTSVAHLAGALGKPVWLLNRIDSCWRWLLDRDDSPWYPTLRQFRQTAPGDWAGVVAAARGALQALIEGDRAS